MIIFWAYLASEISAVALDNLFEPAVEDGEDLGLEVLAEVGLPGGVSLTVPLNNPCRVK